MFAQFKPWRVVACFAVVGLLTAMPPLTTYLFFGVGMLGFVVCPASIIAMFHNPPLDFGWSFFAFGGPLNAALYATYGRLLVHLGRSI
jgi:hypothetical protein